MSTHLVIMAGGIGGRFWPISTPEHPKQFIDVLGIGKSLIQMTFDRFKGIVNDENIWVVTNEKYYEIIRQQLPGIDSKKILLEPTARNTAPCIAWACWMIMAEDPNANIVVTPSDALIINDVEFKKVINNALIFSAQNEALVTIGITPSRPEVGYGYIRQCKSSEPNKRIQKVEDFKEKPDRALAQHYFESGEYLWNAGIFVWNVTSIKNAICKYVPELANQMYQIVSGSQVSDIFPKCERQPIDIAVMEPAANDGMVYVHKADFGWSDLGNWSSLHENLPKDRNVNASIGAVDLFESHDNIIHTENLNRVLIIGLDGYIVSEFKGRLLVCKRSMEQKIKDFL